MDSLLYVFNCGFWFNTDIGADVLDLAETMVASDGLKYEPVSVSFFIKELMNLMLYFTMSKHICFSLISVFFYYF